jgi:toxin ParE1/3/4
VEKVSHTKRSSDSSLHGLQNNLAWHAIASREGGSPASRDDLRDIVRFIARDNPQRAESFGYELMRRADILQQHPEAGRVVPEYRNPQLREIIYRPYRIVYRLNIDRKLIEIARVWHAARGTPQA